VLQNDPFYWGSIRKVVEVFGAVFSDLHFVRFDANGNPYQTIQVPIEHAPKEKWYIRSQQNPMPGTNDPIEIVLPRMSFQLSGWQYDAPRKLTSTGNTVQVVSNNRTVLQSQFNPVPYNFAMTLSIMTKTVEDGLMIIEQILPFFTPDYTVSVNDMPELDLEKDIQIVHDGQVSYNDDWDEEYKERRTVTWDLGFTVKAYLYPPVKLKKVNLQTDINYKIAGSDAEQGNLLPSYTTIPTGDATAPNVIPAKTIDIRNDQTVVVVSDPTSVELSSGESQIFKITVVNALNQNFTATVPVTSQNTMDVHSIDTVNNTFTYSASAGIRTATEHLTVKITSVADSRRSTNLTLVINP
jgi:hypothetical protein